MELCRRIDDETRRTLRELLKDKETPVSRDTIALAAELLHEGLTLEQVDRIFDYMDALAMLQGWRGWDFIIDVAYKWLDGAEDQHWFEGSDDNIWLLRKSSPEESEKRIRDDHFRLNTFTCTKCGEPWNIGCKDSDLEKAERTMDGDYRCPKCFGSEDRFEDLVYLDRADS